MELRLLDNSVIILQMYTCVNGKGKVVPVLK
jgi:hypothetical protein